VTLKPIAKTALWAGGGAYVGVFLGSLLIDAQQAVFWMVPWTFLFLAYVGIVYGVGRERAKLRRIETRGGGEAWPAASHRPPPAAPMPLAVEISFPDVPAGLPLVLGVNDEVRVLVTVRGPRDAAAVRLVSQLRDGAARTLVGEGVAGPDGTIAFTTKPPATGEVELEAEAREGDLEGAARASVSIVRYSEEIERLFGEFRSFAHQSLGPGAEADTARELAEKLRVGASPHVSRALLEIARIYELVAYGQRDADRALYLQLVRALLVLERDHDDATHAGEAVTRSGP
jgi:hypothetical protein